MQTLGSRSRNWFCGGSDPPSEGVHSFAAMDPSPTLFSLNSPGFVANGVNLSPLLLNVDISVVCRFHAACTGCVFQKTCPLPYSDLSGGWWRVRAVFCPLGGWWTTTLGSHAKLSSGRVSFSLPSLAGCLLFLTKDSIPLRAQV